MRKGKDFLDPHIMLSSMEEALKLVGDGPEDVGLIIAIKEGRLMIAFHKDYVMADTHNAIAYSVDLEQFEVLMKGVKQRSVV